MTYQKGLSLIELMITLSILMIILTAVGPSIQSILIKNRVISEINELSSIIQYARHQAIDEQTLVSVCPSTDYTNCSTNWNDPKMVFIDSNADTTRNADEPLLVSIEALSPTNIMTSSENIIQFTETGQASQASALLLCHQDKKAEYARALNVTVQGRVRLSTDSNKDGVFEDTSGINLSC